MDVATVIYLLVIEVLLEKGSEVTKQLDWHIISQRAQLVLSFFLKNN